MSADIIYGLKSYFTFRIDGKLFAVNIGHLLRILEMTDITTVPDSLESFKGIIHFMGDIIPVFDGRLKLGFPYRKPLRETCILIFVFEQHGLPVKSGIVIDSVEKLVLIEQENIQTDCGSISGILSAALLGYAEINEEPIYILDPQNLFDYEDFKLINAAE